MGRAKQSADPFGERFRRWAVVRRLGGSAARWFRGAAVRWFRGAVIP
ncbi:hypothetical protein [Streptomyces sp. NPDC001966]